MTTTLTPNVGALKQRDTLRLCTAGSVDDGKSTFVGRLLYDTKSVLADQVESMERTSTDRGFDGMDLSLLVDGLRAEREQGITIDVAYRYFATDKRTFILADTPGHVQYTRNTVTGMSTSQVVVLLVDARNGVVEAQLKAWVEGDRLKLEARVRDDGPGVDVDRVDSIFEPFVHGSGPDGAGLGLSICRQVIDRMAGRIWAEA